MSMKMLFVVTAILAVASASHAMLGAEQCTWGPSYWCESIANAKKCNTEQHCREKVWVGSHPLAKLTEPIPENVAPPAKPLEDGNCAICEMIATEVLSKLKNNATEEQVIEALDGLCEYCPKTESCKQFVDKYGKELWEEFVANANVKELCSLLGFCSQEFLHILREGKVALLYLRGKTKDIGCDTCSAAMDLVKKEVLANEKAIEQLLDQSCDILPVDKGECTEIVNSIFESAVAYFESYTPAQLCEMLSLCSGTFESIMAPGPVRMDEMPPMANMGPILGKNDDCQNGPSYWCASDKNAKECNMEEFCAKQGIATIF